MTRLLSVARSSGAWPLSLIGICVLTLLTVGCAGSLPPELAGGGGTSGGSGGTMGGNDGGPLPPGCDTSGIFTKYTCTTVCHSMIGAPSFGGFDMTAATFPHSLVGGMPPTPTMANMNKCGGMNQVYLKPGVQPAQGLFLDKVKANPPCGVQMPMGTGMMLTADELTCVQNWANNVVAGGTGK